MRTLAIERRVIEALSVNDQILPQVALSALLWVTGGVISQCCKDRADVAEKFAAALVDIVGGRETLQ